MDWSREVRFLSSSNIQFLVRKERSFGFKAKLQNCGCTFLMQIEINSLSKLYMYFNVNFPDYLNFPHPQRIGLHYDNFAEFERNCSCLGLIFEMKQDSVLYKEHPSNGSGSLSSAKIISSFTKLEFSGIYPVQVIHITISTLNTFSSLGPWFIRDTIRNNISFSVRTL